MSEYSYHLPDLPVQAPDMEKTLTRTFAWMAGGLLLTAAVSWLCAVSGLMYTMLFHPAFALILFAIQIGLTIGFSFAMNKASVTTCRIMFVVFAITMGLSLSSIVFVYTMESIFAAFLISAVYFGLLAIVGFTTKKDLSKLGILCLVGLGVFLLASLIFMLLGQPMSTTLYAGVGLALFTGITAWDVQKLKKQAAMSCDEVWQQKLSVYFALELYLDFINIFLYVLRLISSGSSRK